jgi:hypothetical protein
MVFNSENKEEDALIFASFFNSFTFDFSLRQSISGANLNFYILKQLPMPSPASVRGKDVVINGSSIAADELLAKRALQLNWTANSLNSLGSEFPNVNGPVRWDESERRKQRIKLDAVTAKLYGLGRTEYEFILDSFTILKEREIEEHGSFKMKNQCLSIFESIELE